MTLRTLSFICLIFFIFVFSVAFYNGFSKIPSEGDSLNYHIPVAKAYLNGTIFDPTKIEANSLLKFMPSASQGILSMFYLFHIPLGLFNVFGILFLFLSIFYLGRKINLGNDLSIILASAVATLNGIVRWHDTQIIDIYLASFFAFSLALLLSQEKSRIYFLKLGIVLGMLIGSKYSGLLFGIILILTFNKRLIKKFELSNFLFFFLPILILGFSWYVRNFFVTGNPMYPQGFLIFKEEGVGILNHQVWSVALSSAFGFFGTINAMISEYMIWVLSIPIILAAGILYLFKKINLNSQILLLMLIGILNYGVYLFLPSDNHEHIMVSVIRYSYPAFIPFVAILFILAKKLNFSQEAGVVAVVNMFFLSFPNIYVPKLVFLIVPITLFIFKKYFTSDVNTNHKRARK